MVTMRYDGEGRRVELAVRPNGQAATTTTFRYQGSAIAQELTGGVLARTYLTDEAGTIVKVCDPDCSGTQYLVTYNGHGDALALWRIGTDGTLTLANSFSYSTWGAPTVYNAAGTALAWNDAANLRFRFLYVGAHGVAWDDFGLGLGLLYMSARHYHPVLGRFLQPDPSALETNLYAYAGNSPVTKIDPDGKLFWFAAFAVARIAIAVAPAVAAVVRVAPRVAPIASRAAPIAQRVAPTANAIGQAGERAVRAVYNIGPRGRFKIAGRERFPDGLTPRVLTEIKNVR